MWGTWGSLTIQETPSRIGTRTALSTYRRVGTEAKSPQCPTTTYASLLPQPPFYDGATLGVPQEKASLSQPDSPRLEGTSHSVLLGDGLSRLVLLLGKGLTSSSLKGYPGPSVEGTVLGWGRGRGWTSPAGSETR